MYSSGINLNAASYNNVFSSSSGALFVPVKPSAVIYSQLDYVHGTAVKNGQNGVPLNKVRILNTLINQLVSMKQKTASHSESELELMSEDQKDALIKEYQQQIKAAVSNTAQPSTYGFAGLMPEAGAVVSVNA